jgi:hypothetical protein
MRTDLSARGDPAGLPTGDVSVAHPLRGRIRCDPAPGSAPAEAPEPALVTLALHVDDALLAAGRFAPFDLAALRRSARGVLRSRGWTIVVGRGQAGAPIEARISIQPMPVDPASAAAPAARVLVGLQAIVTPEPAAVSRMRQLRDYTIARLDGPAEATAGASRIRTAIDAVIGGWLRRVF